MSDDFNAFELSRVPPCLLLTRDNANGNIGASKLSVASQDRSVLRPVEIKLEDHAMGLLELAAALPREEWAQRSVCRAVITLGRVSWGMITSSR